MRSQDAVSVRIKRSLWRETQALPAGDALTDTCIPRPIASIGRPPYWGAHGGVIFRHLFEEHLLGLGGRGLSKTLSFTLTQHSFFSLLVHPPVPPSPVSSSQNGRRLLSGASCLAGLVPWERQNTERAGAFLGLPPAPTTTG